MEIKKPQLGKVGAFAIFLKREVLQHLLWHEVEKRSAESATPKTNCFAPSELIFRSDARKPRAYTLGYMSVALSELRCRCCNT